MNESIRIWKEIGLRYLYRPVSFPLKHRSQPGTHLGDEAVGCHPAPSLSPDAYWPTPLQEYWMKIEQPVSVIVTYLNLDIDFRGSPNRSRLELLDSIIKATSWQRKRIAFWPPVLQGHGTIAPSASMAAFTDLIDILTPRYILCFGDSTHHLFLEYLPQLTATVSENSPTRLVQLPSLEDMLPDNKFVKKEAWEIIRTLTI